MKKSLVLLLSLIMLITLFAGCSGQSSQTTTAATTTAATATTAAVTTAAATTASGTTAAVTTTSATTASSEVTLDTSNPGALPIVSEPYTLSFAMPINAVIENRETNELWKYLQEQTGITFTLEEYPSDEYATKLDLMMAAGGKDLADVLCGASITAAVRTNWGQAGYILDLKDIMNEWCYYLPIAFNNCDYTDWDTALTQITSYDGCIYGLPSYAESPNDRVSSGRINFYIPWVEKSGMLQYDENGEFFRTADQVLAYYDWVKTSDPNGNGQADEIPLTGYGTGNIKYAFLPMFLNRNPDAFYIDTNDNTVKYNFTTEEYREGLRFIKTLFDNGYLDPLTYTQDHAAMTAMITADTMTVASFMRISASNMSRDMTVPTNFYSWEWCSALAAPGETERYQFYGKAIPYVQWVVSANCENPEIAVRLGDYWGSEEVSFINNCGFHGEDYDFVSELSNGNDYGNAWGWPLDQVYVRRTPETGGRAQWGTMQNVWMGNQGVSCLNYAWATQSGVLKTDATAWECEVRNANRILYNITLSDQSNVLAGQVYDLDETTVQTDVYTSITTYADECFTRFTMGDLDIDNDWDNYIKELEAMGLQQVIDAENSCFNRMYK